MLCAVAWLAGVALQLQQARLWPAGVYGAGLALAGLLALCAALLARRRFNDRAVGVLALVAALLLGFSSAGLRGSWRLQEALPAALEGRDLQVTGVIASLPQNNLSGTRFVFDVEAAALAGAAGGTAVQIPPRISLGWYRGFDADALLASPGIELRAGQRWRLTVRLRQPHGNLNPHGFDLELWLFEQGIRASGYVRSQPGAVNDKLADAVAYPVERWRQAVRDAIDRHVSQRTAAGVLAALAVGDQAAIEREDWDLFRATGVAHLMSISGLHVTMFAWLAGGVVAWLWRRSSRLTLALPVPMAARWGGLAAALFYALFSGWGVPAQRTVWMIAVVVLLRSLGWRWPQTLVLLAAGVVVSAADPWALLQPGFWLSFVAVALLINSEAAHLTNKTAALPATRWRDTLRAGLRTQVVATVGLAPLSMVFFQQISIVGFIANLVAIPVVTLLVTPLALLGVLLPWLWVAAAAVVRALMWALGGLAQTPWGLWSAAAAPAWAAALGLAGGALLILPLPWRLRLLGLPLMLPLLAPPVERPAEGDFEAVAVDVGQGTAVLVRTRQHLLVYDTGPQYSLEADAGQRVLLPLLAARGEAQIDQLVLSHRDIDHVGGAVSLLVYGDVRAITSSLEPGHPLLSGTTPHTPCAAGQSWAWDGVRFEVLHPLPADTGTLAKPNFLSCVLRVQGRSGSLLLTGDIEAPQEAALLQRNAAALKSDVMLVPHHGSRTSSTPAFIDAVAPRVAVVQAGYRSRFGHPVPEIVQRYTERGAEVVRSDRCGAWTWQSPQAPTTTGVCERQRSARYWHHPALAAPP
jgi:competence protein ComEC